MSVGRPELCVGAVAIEDGALLMVQRAAEPGLGQWAIPGGHVEAGESLISAVVRELREETGLEGLCGPLLGWVERAGTSHHHVILNFEVTVLGSGQPVGGDDVRDARWASLAEVSEMDLVEGMEAFLIDNAVIPASDVFGGT